MCKYLDLNIDFPEIEGYSMRQIGYADALREQFIIQHEDELREIDRIVQLECDKRINGDEWDIQDTLSLEFDDDMMCCLFSTDAGVIISRMREKIHDR